jgi:tryptophan-rich sensory protein
MTGWALRDACFKLGSIFLQVYSIYFLCCCARVYRSSPPAVRELIPFVLWLFALHMQTGSPQGRLL